LPDKVGIIRSYHDFGGFPSDLAGLWARLLALKGTITKLAVQVNRTSELVKLLAWMESLPPSERVILGMGPFGKISRLLGERLGSRWTYVAENAACAAAPGQFGLCEIESLGLPLAADACAELYGVIGNPLVHSLSPPLHNRLFSHYGVNAAYLPLQLSEVDSWFEYLERASLPFRGFSVTLPFKRDVLQHLVSVDSPVTSVNTLVRRGAGWHGLNTDYSGFLQPFRAGSLKGKRALVLGAGGAAHTVVAALQSEGAEVTVAGRDPERLKQFEAAYRCRCVLFSELPESADLCVNTTPVGQFPDTERSPLPPDRLNFGLVYDLIYRPERTRLLKDAQARGIPTISGMQMFVEQAAGQFHAWTGVNPDRALVAELVRSLTETQNGGDAE
jgi:3-dehydroquinate dehydratase/shikimate dehydrogenase